jgi:hypothetical protein
VGAGSRLGRGRMGACGSVTVVRGEARLGWFVYLLLAWSVVGPGVHHHR